MIYVFVRFASFVPLVLVVPVKKKAVVRYCNNSLLWRSCSDCDLADGDAVRLQIRFQFADVDHVEMEDGGGEEDGRTRFHGIEEMLEFACAAGSDDGGFAGIRHRFDDG